MAKKKPVIYIVGPTASGKTSFSVELAEKFEGEIISPPNFLASSTEMEVFPEAVGPTM